MSPNDPKMENYNQYQELSPFVWGLQVYYRVAARLGEAAPESFKEEGA